MMKSIKRVIFVISFLMLGIVLVGRPISAKTVTQNLKMLQGSIRFVEHNCSDVENITIKNKKIISVKGKSYMNQVTAKKAGKTSFTYRLPEDEKLYKCNVTVYSLKSVRKKVSAELKKQLSVLPKGTMYTYLDFNQDGVKELFYDGKIMYYDYAKNKCKTVNYGFQEIYTSPKTKRIYVIKKKPVKTDFFTYFSEFYTASPYKIFALTGEGTGFRTYTKKGIREYSAKAPYAYYDEHYDQDDYDYEALTEKEMIAKIEKMMPGYKKVVLKKVTTP